MSEEFSDQPPDTTSQPCPLRQITIVLYDEAGKPVEGEQVLLRKEGEPDKEGTTDAEGKTLVEDLHPGRWEVSFPKRAFDEWHRVETAETPATWVDIALLDDQGEPLSGEPYAVLGPDGTTKVEGKLGQDGRARVEVESAGLCKVNFPERSAIDWWPLSAERQRELSYRPSGPPTTLGSAKQGSGSSPGGGSRG